MSVSEMMQINTISFKRGPWSERGRPRSSDIFVSAFRAKCERDVIFLVVA